MRTLLVPAGLVSLLAGTLACESTPPPVVPVAPVATVAAPAPVAATTTYDLAPVAEPADVVGTLRWKSPSASLTALAGCAGVPAALSEMGAKALVEAVVGDGLRGQVDTKALAGIVALDTPVDGVMTLDEQRQKALAVVSVGLASLEGAKGAIEAKGPLVEATPGVWSIGDKDRDVTCVVAASAGSTPARLVCGPHKRDVAALTPYLTRTVPTLASGASDVHAELRFAPVDARYGGQLRQQLKLLPAGAMTQGIGEPAFDRALVQGAGAIADEVGALMSDLDRVSLDVTFDPGSCLTASGALQMKGKTSWVAGTMADRPERAGAPPAIFWRAPKDSDSVFFARSADPARYADIYRSLRTLLDGALTKGKVGSPADRKALEDLISFPMGKDASTVHASGHETAAPAKGAKPQDAFNTLANAYLGWNLVGIDESSEAVSKYLKDVVAAYNLKGLQTPLRKELHGDAKYLPIIKLAAAPAGLPKGSFAIEITLNDLPAPDGLGASATPSLKVAGGPVAKLAAAAKGKGGKGADGLTVTAHLIVMPDGKNTWLAFGTNRDELVRRLAMVKAGAPDSGTIGARGGLDWLRNGRTMAGGYMSLSPLIKAAGTAAGVFAGLAPSGASGEVAQLLNTANNLPNKGLTPIFVTKTVTGGNAPRTELSLVVNKGTFEDLGTLMMAVVRLAGGHP